MNILIYANCQTNQLVYSFSFALAGVATVSAIDMNHEDHKAKLAAFFQSNEVDYVITNTESDELKKYCSEQQIVKIPTIHFGGFHPDVVNFALESMPDNPILFMKTPTVSAIALWSAINGIEMSKASTLYNEQVFSELGYIEYFDSAADAIRNNYHSHGIDMAYIDRFLASRDVFMYGPMHPKFEVTLSMCFGVLAKLGIQPANELEHIKGAIIDPLQYEYYWGCFPPLASHLGVEASWFIRHHSHTFFNIPTYLENLYPFIQQVQQQAGKVQMINRDKKRFEQFHNIDQVLRSHI